VFVLIWLVRSSRPVFLPYEGVWYLVFFFADIYIQSLRKFACVLHDYVNGFSIHMFYVRNR
jgi:hypothetical protein